MCILNYIITKKCNALCNNCPVKKEEKTMAAETFFKVSAVLLSDKLNDFNTVKFFGGEPLLNFKLIQQGYSFIKKKKMILGLKSELMAYCLTMKNTDGYLKGRTFS